jgi:E3 SUMO-protein ligase PIAS1
MANPMRSTQCNHIQCFDASSWFQINEQTPTWACPVCEKVLRLNELFIDECVFPPRDTSLYLCHLLTYIHPRSVCSYTATIVKTVPSSVDEVIVEPNAQWHTIDRKYGDPGWLADPSNSVPVSRPVSLRSSPVGDAKGKGREQDNVEVFVLDSEDEDDDGGHAPYALDYVVSRDVTPLGNSAELIDLTLSSDEDSPPRPPASPSRASSSSTNNLTVPGAAGGSSAGFKRSATEEVASGTDKRGRYEDERGQESASREGPFAPNFSLTHS